MLIVNTSGKYREAQRSKFTVIFNPTTRDNHSDFLCMGEGVGGDERESRGINGNGKNTNKK